MLCLLLWLCQQAHQERRAAGPDDDSRLAPLAETLIASPLVRFGIGDSARQQRGTLTDCSTPPAPCPVHRSSHNCWPCR